MNNGNVLRAWTAEDGTARSVSEVVAEEPGPSLRWATTTTTRATRSQDQEQSGVAAIGFGLSPDHGSGTFLVDVDALLPAAPAFAIPLAVCAAQKLPAVKSESASPGLGHRGLLGHEP